MIEGGCQCGGVRYTVDAEPRTIFVCHCQACQRQSASAFGVSVDVPEGSLRILSGSTRRWTRPTPTGELICHFCPTCGSRLWHQADPPDGKVTLKGGCMDTPPDLSRAVHIWTSRKLPGVAIPADCQHYPGDPPKP